MNNLLQYYQLFKNSFGDLGDLYFAGGCVRDYHLGLKPRDYDLFVLNSGTDKNTLRQQMFKPHRREIVNFTEAAKPVNSSSKWVARNININGDLIQVIWSPKKTIHELMEAFDWNICQYAYGEVNSRLQFIHTTHPRQLIKDKKLKLIEPGEIPASCLRRGFLFSDRYNMYIDRPSLKTLCELQLQKIDKENMKDILDI